MTDRHHVIPLNDSRGHVEDGSPCPCLPRERDDVVTHNSYDGREIGEVCAKALDLLGIALVHHEHTWSDEEREAYEHALTLLQMHYDIGEPPAGIGGVTAVDPFDPSKGNRPRR